MPFFEINNLAKGKKYRIKLTSLWAIKYLYTLCKNKFIHKKINNQKRVSFFTCRKSFSGSITLEIAIVFPILFFAIISLVSLIDIVKIESCMDIGVSEVGNEISIDCYGIKNDSLLLTTTIYSRLNSFLKNNLSKKDVEKIAYTITILDTDMTEDIIQFKVNYNIETDYHFFGLKRVYLDTKYYGHNFCGFQKQKEEEIMVYVSDRETVYHTNKNCTHLKLTIYSVQKDTLDVQRNQNGGKYKQCNFCMKKEDAEIVFITPEGDCYHNTRSCIGLTRTIHTVPLYTVMDKRKCTRCGNED